MRLFVTASAITILAACAASVQAPGVILQPRASAGGGESAIYKNTAIVLLRGKYSSPGKARSTLLYQCAALTRQNGYTYFIIVGDNRGFQTASDAPAGAFPPPNTTALSGPSGVNSPDSPFIGGPAIAGRDPQAIDLKYEITMFHGDKPANNPHAYYASDILETVGPELGLPSN